MMTVTERELKATCKIHIASHKMIWVIITKIIIKIFLYMVYECIVECKWIIRRRISNQVLIRVTFIILN